jgi:segregation and condensation protein A
VTLQELIEQLQTIADALDDKPQRSRVRRSRNQPRSQAIRAIAQLAHQENLSEMAVALEQFFAEQREALAQHQNWLEFELLIELWSQVEQTRLDASQTPPGPNHDRVGIFWALLLLSAQSKVELEQTEFYQDLKVRVLSPRSPSNSEDSTAPSLPD